MIVLLTWSFRFCSANFLSSHSVAIFSCNAIFAIFCCTFNLLRALHLLLQSLDKKQVKKLNYIAAWLIYHILSRWWPYDDNYLFLYWFINFLLNWFYHIFIWYLLHFVSDNILVISLCIIIKILNFKFYIGQMK